MNLDFSNVGEEVKASMIPNIKNILEDIWEEITGTGATPSADHLFDIRNAKESKKLPEEQAITFHHNVAKPLFICNRA